MAINGVAQALSDGTRRSILRLVRDAERSAGDLAGEFPTMSRPAVSQHLRVLHETGLVTVRSDGSRRMYAARTEGLADIWHYLDEMWTDRLGRLKAAAEHAQSSEHARRQLDPTSPDARSDASKRPKFQLPTRSPRG